MTLSAPERAIVDYIVMEEYERFIPKHLRHLLSIWVKVFHMCGIVEEGKRTLKDIMPTFRRVYGQHIHETTMQDMFLAGELKPPEDRAKFADYGKLMKFLKCHEEWQHLGQILDPLPHEFHLFMDRVMLLQRLLLTDCESLKPIFEALLERFESVVSQLPPAKFEDEESRADIDAVIPEVLEYLRSIIVCTQTPLDRVERKDLVEHLHGPSSGKCREFLKRLNEDIERFKKNVRYSLGANDFLERLHEIIKSI